MLVVVDEACDEGAKDVMFLEAFDDVAVDHEVMHALDAVEDVRHAVVGVLLEVAHLNLASKRGQVLQWYVEDVEEVMVLEDLEGEELEGALVENVLEGYGIEGYRMQFLRRALIQFTSQRL